MRDNSGKIILALLAGASAGVIAGLLMAPDTGEATRDTLRKTASRFGKDVESRLQPLLDRLSELNAGELLNNLTGGTESGSDSGNKAGGSTAGNSGTGASRTGTTGTTGSTGTTGTTGGGIGGATTSSGSASSGGGAGIGGGVGV